MSPYSLEVDMKTFTIIWNESDKEEFTLDEMLAGNSDDEPLCEWLNTCDVGESFAGMGCSVVRTA
jgi:hypothetical protein